MLELRPRLYAPAISGGSRGASHGFDGRSGRGARQVLQLAGRLDAPRQMAPRPHPRDRRDGRRLRGLAPERVDGGAQGASPAVRGRAEHPGAVPARGLHREQGRTRRDREGAGRRARRGRLAVPRDGAPRRAVGRGQGGRSRRPPLGEGRALGRAGTARGARGSPCARHCPPGHQARQPLLDERGARQGARLWHRAAA